MRVNVNRDKCVGIGVCEELAPNVFEVGDDCQTHLIVDDIADHDIDAVKRAVASCPTESLTVAAN